MKRTDQNSHHENDGFSKIVSSTHVYWEILGKLMDVVIEKLDRPLNLDELAQNYSKACDDIILKSIKGEGLSFVGGKFYFELVGEEEFSAKVEAYFKDMNDEWVKKENKSSNFLKCLTPDSQKELVNKKLITYELTNPTPGKM